jgi:hypothetical protein
MTRLLILLTSFFLISACGNIGLRLNSPYSLFTYEFEKQHLQEFISEQQAIESGAYYLGDVEGLSCLGERSVQSGGYNPTEVTSIAIEQLKLEVVNRGGNGYWVESCKDFTSDYQNCDVATVCKSKAYSS